MSKKNDKITILLDGVCSFIIENIKGRITIIYEAYKFLENAKRIGSWLHAFKAYLEVDPNNDEQLYLSVVSTFASKVSSVTDDTRTPLEFI